MQISDETLMALADGELAPELAREVSAAVDRDPALAARLGQFTQSRQVLRDWGAQVDPPLVDPAVEAMIRAASAPQAKSGPANLNRRPLAAVAAALALAVVGLGLYAGLGDGGADGGRDAQMAALDRLPSGESQALGDGSELVVIASYRNGVGEFCREYELHGGPDGPRLHLACHQDGTGWDERFSIALSGQDGGFVPASGQVEALDDFLRETGAGAPMTDAEEQSALAGLR